MALSNPLEAFVWGAGGARKTPEEIAREREIAAALLGQGVDTSPVGHWTQGAARVVNALGGVMKERRANKAAGQNAEESQSRIAKLLGGMGGQTSQFPTAPVSGGQTAAAPPDYPSQRVAQAFGDGDNATAIRQGLVARGLPEHVADAFVMNFKDESNLNPGINEASPLVPGSRGGFGLAQWTGPRRKALEAYASSKGVDPGDMNAQMDFLMQELQGTEAKAAQAILSAQDTGSAAAAIVNQFLRPAEEHRARREARYLGAQQPGQPMPTMPLGPGAAQQADSAVPGGAPMPEMAGNAPQPVQMAQNGNNMQAIIEALSSPYASPQERDIAGILLQQNMQQNDPMRAMEMEKMRMEMDALRNPQPKYDFLTGRDGSIFRTDNTGKMEQVYGGKPDKPTDVQEYEYARGQGFQGSFADWQLAQKRAGASQVNIDQKVEGAFDKKLAEGQAESLNVMATDGMNARADLGVITELETLLGQNGGTTSGIAGWLAQRGIGGEGMSDLQAAQALINRLVPTQRQPGSGSMSDRDVELFTRSLPSLWNTPGGNQRILGVMRGLAQYKQAQGDIAARVLSGEMNRQQATAALRALPNPLAQTGKGSRIERNGYVIEQVD